MTEDVRIYVVDRVEGDTAVLVPDGGGDPVDVSLGVLPPDTREGRVLFVPVEPDDTPRWADARPDEILEAERRAEAEEIQGRLRERDPGGDVVL